jgi:hypothetical protein
MTLPTYTFLAWLRQGLGNHLQAPLAGAVRAAVEVRLKLSGTGGPADVSAPVERNVQLYGPGDVVGIDRRAIFRSEPRHWITNYEPNYLAHVEFYDEDLPWRYTPAPPSPDGRLAPWLALVVLAEGEFTDGKDASRPLPFIEVPGASTLFPPAEKLWAWAHVHVNAKVTPDDEVLAETQAEIDQVVPALQAAVAANRDVAYSRLICPRQLQENTAYHAFVVPAFESGRLAGLGLDPAQAPGALHNAWAAYADPAKRQEPARHPFYHRWFFRTGAAGEFESLVRLLKPRPADARVGTRDMDVKDPDPGTVLPAVGEAPPENALKLGGVLKLGGALRVPDSALSGAQRDQRDFYENWTVHPAPQVFRKALADFINLSDGYTDPLGPDAGTANQGAGADGVVPNDDPDDPLITPPLYGTWHALTRRLLVERDNATPVSHPHNWVHELNLDPRHRVAAGFGTRVVQENQERYMDAAWEQVGDVLEANRRIRLAQLALEISWVWYDSQLVPLQGTGPEKLLYLTAPVHRRVLIEGFTLHHLRARSRVQAAYTSVALRRMMRPGGRIARYAGFTAQAGPHNLLDRVNAGEVSAAPPVRTPELVTVDEVAEHFGAGTVPAWLREPLRKMPWIVWVPLILALLILLLVMLVVRPPRIWVFLALFVAAVLIWLWWLMMRWLTALAAGEALSEHGHTPGAVDRLPKSPDFVVSLPGSGFRPKIGGTDSVEAVRFKDALRDAFAVQVASKKAAETPPLVQLNLPALTLAVLHGLDPRVTLPRRTWGSILLPGWMQVEIGERFVEAMAYPRIDEPMYKPLADISSELFLPNLNLIEQNSITLLETNQDFIESYMVGLNHEFARELLWREYPTDQRGSYFRQFWDVSAYLKPKEASGEADRDKLRDIPQLHLWSRMSDLGSHDHREREGDKEEEVVLVIRGELLKRYPTAVIYAHHAAWDVSSGSVDKTKPRDLDTPTAADLKEPPRDKVRTPLYQAKVEPDIYFFGFDLTAAAARGAGDEPGWFFVIKERPGEPRFGLDMDSSVTPPQVWNDLAWDKVTVQSGHLSPPGAGIGLAAPPASDEDRVAQHKEDAKVSWNGAMTSAEMAYVLYQAPVMVAVHGREMLPMPASP